MRGRTMGQRRVAAEALKKGLLDRVAGYQQLVLLLAGALYAFGYLSRALNAWENNLGALPGVRFEYLVAGTLLLTPPVALCLAGWGVWRSAKWLVAWAAKADERKARVQYTLTSGMLLGLGIVFLGSLLSRESVQIVGVFFAIGCFLYLLIYFQAGGEAPATPAVTKKSASGEAPSTSAATKEGASGDASSTSAATKEGASVRRGGKISSWLGWLARAAGYVVTAFFALWIGLLLFLLLILAVGYGAIALNYVPQELGGVKPKCGVLDLSPEQLSPELRTLIASPGQQLDPSSKVVRSIPLEVFTTSEPWLVHLPRAAVGGPPRSIRLDGKVVLSVEWCR